MCWPSPYVEILGVRAARFVPPKKMTLPKFAHVRKAVQELDPTPNQSFFFSWADQKSSNRRIFWFCYPFSRILIFSFSFQNLQALYLTWNNAFWLWICFPWVVNLGQYLLEMIQAQSSSTNISSSLAWIWLNFLSKSYECANLQSNCYICNLIHGWVHCKFFLKLRPSNRGKMVVI
jgi:hypothetical protein